MIMKHQKVWNRMVEVNDTSNYVQAHGPTVGFASIHGVKLPGMLRIKWASMVTVGLANG
jgi:hypothetical protein